MLALIPNLVCQRLDKSKNVGYQVVAYQVALPTSREVANCPQVWRFEKYDLPGHCFADFVGCNQACPKFLLYFCHDL